MAHENGRWLRQGKLSGGRTTSAKRSDLNHAVLRGGRHQPNVRRWQVTDAGTPPMQGLPLRGPPSWPCSSSRREGTPGPGLHRQRVLRQDPFSGICSCSGAAPRGNLTRSSSGHGTGFAFSLNGSSTVSFCGHPA